MELYFEIIEHLFTFGCTSSLCCDEMCANGVKEPVCTHMVFIFLQITKQIQ